MAILKNIDIKYGNIRHNDNVTVLPDIDVYCPICDDIHDGILDEHEVIRPDCGCDLDDYIHVDEYDDVKEERDDAQIECDNMEDELAEAIEERDKLIEELEELKERLKDAES